MIIQILNNNFQPTEQFERVVEVCKEACVFYEMGEIKWIYSDEIKANSDVLFKLNEETIQIGIKSYFDADSLDEGIKWVDVEFIGKSHFDPISQVILPTVCTNYVPAPTGFSVDWFDVHVLLNKGSKAYSCTFKWEDFPDVFLDMRNTIPKNFKISGLLMLLNECSTYQETYPKINLLVKTGYFNEGVFLSILNITFSEKIPATNFFLFVGDSINLE